MLTAWRGSTSRRCIISGTSSARPAGGRRVRRQPNVYTEDYIVVGYDGGDPGYQFHTPSFDKQIALGISGRAEFVMPYFTVGFGLGFNVLHKGGDLKSFYQMLTLKVGVTRNTFVHVGYCLKDFQTPGTTDAGRRVPLTTNTRGCGKAAAP